MSPTKAEAPLDAKSDQVGAVAIAEGKEIAATTIEFITQATDLTIEKLEKFPRRDFLPTHLAKRLICRRDAAFRE